jgi:TonB family protein
MVCLGATSLLADIRVSMADALKAATSKVQPQYPSTARQMKIAGAVEIEAVISPSGDVDSAKAVSGNPLLTGPTVSAVEKWKFTPFVSDGAPTKAVVLLRFDFKP